MKDAFEMLMQDHREVERMLGRLEEAPEGQRKELLAQLESALALHMEIEEEHVYPIAARLVDQESAQEAEIEHDLATEGLEKAKSLADAPGFGAVVEMLRAGIAHHVEEEESEMFPALRREMDDGAREQLAQTVREAKAAGPQPGSRRAGRRGAAAARGTEKSKQELLEEAREAGIPGRSSMTKKELQDALGRR